MLLQHIPPAIGALPTAGGKAISYIKSNKIILWACRILTPTIAVLQ
jgi:hypothetical protein